MILYTTLDFCRTRSGDARNIWQLRHSFTFTCSQFVSICPGPPPLVKGCSLRSQLSYSTIMLLTYARRFDQACIPFSDDPSGKDWSTPLALGMIHPGPSTPDFTVQQPCPTTNRPLNVATSSVPPRLSTGLRVTTTTNLTYRFLREDKRSLPNYLPGVHRRLVTMPGKHGG